jgi:hypothetical protein
MVEHADQEMLKLMPDEVVDELHSAERHRDRIERRQWRLASLKKEVAQIEKHLLTTEAELRARYAGTGYVDFVSEWRDKEERKLQLAPMREEIAWLEEWLADERQNPRYPPSLMTTKALPARYRMYFRYDLKGNLIDTDEHGNPIGTALTKPPQIDHP